MSLVQKKGKTSQEFNLAVVVGGTPRSSPSFTTHGCSCVAFERAGGGGKYGNFCSFTRISGEQPQRI